MDQDIDQKLRDIQRQYLDFLDDEVSSNVIVHVYIYVYTEFNLFREIKQNIRSWLKICWLTANVGLL